MSDSCSTDGGCSTCSFGQRLDDAERGYRRGMARSTGPFPRDEPYPLLRARRSAAARQRLGDRRDEQGRRSGQGDRDEPAGARGGLRRAAEAGAAHGRAARGHAGRATGRARRSDAMRAFREQIKRHKLRDEADPRRIQLRRQAADLLLLGGESGRFPRSGQRSGEAFRRADRPAPGRRARRGPPDRWRRQVRALALLLQLAPDLPLGDGEAGEGAGSAAEPDEDLRGLRAAPLLPQLRERAIYADEARLAAPRPVRADAAGGRQDHRPTNTEEPGRRLHRGGRRDRLRRRRAR